MIHAFILLWSLLLGPQAPGRGGVAPPRLDPGEAVASISGRVTLRQTGAPLPGITVWALRKAHSEEGVRITTTASSAITDDQGRYRIPLPSSGRYYIVTSALAVNGTDVFVPAYYPDTTDESLVQHLHVERAQHVDAIDFVIRRSQRVSISGRLLDGLGRRLPHIDWVWLVRRPSFVEVSFSRPAFGSRLRFENRNEYEIDNILPGSYYLCAYRFDDEEHRADTVVPITVTDEDLNIDLISNESYELTGRIRFEGPRLPLTPPSPIRIIVRPVNDPESIITQQARIRRDGTFGFLPLPAGFFSLAVLGVPAPYYVKSASLGPLDVFEKGFSLGTDHLRSLEIVIANNGGQVTGTVLDASGKPSPRASVVLIPETRGLLRPDRYKLDVSDVNGQFSMTGVAPGDYKIYAWQQLEQGAYFDPEFMGRFEGIGVELQVTAGATANVNLTRIDNGQ